LVRFIECADHEALRECVRQLRAEIYAFHKNGDRIDIRISVIHGVRYRLQKWPFVALVHGKDVIPLDPLDDLEPIIDQEGSLYQPVSLLDRTAAEPSAAAGPAEVAPAAESAGGDDGADQDEEGLPPGENPQITA
jgi:hypothetical protein